MSLLPTVTQFPGPRCAFAWGPRASAAPRGPGRASQRCWQEKGNHIRHLHRNNVIERLGAPGGDLGVQRRVASCPGTRGSGPPQEGLPSCLVL